MPPYLWGIGQGIRDKQGYMEFPTDRMASIPRYPAEVMRRSWLNFVNPPFMDWIGFGLRSVKGDIIIVKEQAIERFKKDGRWILQADPSPSLLKYPDEYKTVGSIELEATYIPGRNPEVATLKVMNDIVETTKKEANQLLRVLIQCTLDLYGTENPRKGWPALLRAAARGWAIVTIKSELGRCYQKPFDFDASNDDNQLDYIMELVHVGDEEKLRPLPKCPARITTYLVDVFINGKVPLFQNYESQSHVPMLNMKIGDPSSLNDPRWWGRLNYFKPETDFLVNSLFPLDYCVRLMFDL